MKLAPDFNLHEAFNAVFDWVAEIPLEAPRMTDLIIWVGNVLLSNAESQGSGPDIEMVIEICQEVLAQHPRICRMGNPERESCMLLARAVEHGERAELFNIRKDEDDASNKALLILLPKGYERLEQLKTELQKKAAPTAAREGPAPPPAAAGQAVVTSARPMEAVGDDKPKRFAVALSFPGEVRDYVSQVAAGLARALGGGAVFYDRNFKSELARPNLDIYLQRIYHDESQLLVVFLSGDYQNKEWCGLEWRAIRDLIKKRRSDEVMFFRTDDAQVDGSYSIDGHIDTRDCQPDEAVRLILERLKFNRSKP